MKLQNLNVGDKVGIAKSGGMYGLRSEGIYTVVKVDKVKIVVQREHDKYERTFSIKSGNEKGSSRYYSAFIETEAEQLERDAATALQDSINAAWEKVSAATKNKSVADAEAAIAALKLVVNAA